MITATDLSPDQTLALEAVRKWLAAPRWTAPGEDVFALGGYAGTGKTSVLGVLARELREAGKRVAYVTFTGRASGVLKKSLANFGVGLDVHTHIGTIHSLIYRPRLDTGGRVIGWSRRDELNPPRDLIVVDEASMVSTDMLTDLGMYGVPILAVGDHGQLPPVQGTSRVVSNPDIRLEKIHRQSEGSPIIALATRIREGLGWNPKQADGAIVSYGLKTNVRGVLYAQLQAAASPLDVGLLCWTNKSRLMLNSMARALTGHAKCPPSSGEPVICLRNAPPVYNGMRGLMREDAVEGLKPWWLKLPVDFHDEGIVNDTYRALAPQFMREKTFNGVEEIRERGCTDVFSMKGVDLFDFGYAMSVHKAQGSSFESVIVYCDRPYNPRDTDWRRFYYTAATRARSSLVILQ